MTWANEPGDVFRDRYPERKDIYRSFSGRSSRGIFWFS